MTNWGDMQLKKQEDRRSNPRNRKRGAREGEEFNGAALDMKFLVLYRHLGFSGVLTIAQHWYLSSAR